MGRKATGQVREIPNRNGSISYAIRFPAYGRRRQITLGRSDEGYTRKQAEVELENTLADVRRGIWQPDAPVAVADAPTESPTFHEFASEWLEMKEPEVAPKTAAGYRWALELHLLPVFARYRLDQIGVADVDRYKSAKLREGALGPAQINKTTKLMAQILDRAMEYGVLPEGRNVARGKGRRLREPKPERVWVEPEQLPSLLEMASQRMRPLLATLAGGGLRPNEALALDWRDVNLATGTIQVGRAKTDAGSFRAVDLPGGLVEELATWRAQSPRSGASDPVFVNREARRQTLRNVEKTIKTTVRHANERLSRLGIEPMSQKVTPYSLRRTYASVRYALGDDPVYIAEQIGHDDSGELSMRVYARAIKRRGRLNGVHLIEYDKALEWAQMGTSGADAVTLGERAEEPQTPDPALESRNLQLGPDSSAG